MRDIDDITAEVIDAALRIHIELGPGLLESAYEMVLAAALERRGLKVERQVVVSFVFQGMTFSDAFRVDLLVESSVVVELKSVQKLSPVFAKQVLTYLRLMDLRVGLLINFGGATFKEGLKRVVNRHTSASKTLPLLPKR